MRLRLLTMLLFSLLIVPFHATGAVLTPLNDTTEFVRQLYRDFLNREADPDGLSYWVGQIDGGLKTRAEAVDGYLLSPEFGEKTAPVVRLYFAYFLRIPDYDGLMYWVGRYGDGTTLDEISDAFATSPEFTETYGSLSNAEFVQLVYQNVLGREPDPDGFAYWINELETGGHTRGQVMRAFSEADEYRALTNSQVYVTMVYIGLLRRSPDAGGFEYWTGRMDNGDTGQILIDGFLTSDEYAARFASGEVPIAETPPSLSVPAVDPDGAYVVSWRASATAGASYVVEEAADAAFTTNVRTLSAAVTGVQITGREQGKIFYYRVKAVKDGYQESPWLPGPNGCAVRAATSWQKSVLAFSTEPANIKVRNGEVFWSEASDQPLQKISLAGGASTPLAGHYGVPYDLTVAGPYLYWSDGAVRRTQLDGSATETLLDAAPIDQDYPDLLVDDSHFYFITAAGSPPVYTIERTPLSGGAPTTIATSEWYRIVALAQDSGNIYFQVNRFPDPEVSSEIRRLAKSGGSIEVVASGLKAFKGGMVLYGGNLYFTDNNYYDASRIMRVSAAGGDVEVLATVQSYFDSTIVWSLAVDEAGVYWLTDAGLWTVPLTGGAPTLLAAAEATPTDLVLTADRVLWTEGMPVGPVTGGRVRSIAKAGGATTDVVTVSKPPLRLAMAGDFVYWTEGGYYGAIEGYGRIAQAPLAGGAAATFVTGVQSLSPPFAVDDRYLYVADGWVVKKLPVSGGLPEVLAYGGDEIASIDTDGVNVYWIDRFANVLKVPTAGGAVSALNTVFTGGPPGPLRVLDGYVYWMDHYDTIRRVAVTGGSEISLVSGTLPFLADFVVDSASAYFSEWDTGWIKKVPSAGGAVTPLAFADFGPTLLTVDNGILYWMGLSMVGSISTAGGNVQVPYWYESDYEWPSSVTNDQTSLYWTDAGMWEIVRLTPQ